MRPFETKTLGERPDAVAPDGTSVRLLLSLAGGSFAHFELPAGAVLHAVAHRSVEEIWYVLSGRGRVWRRAGEKESVVDAAPGLCLTIPLGTHFQFRAEREAPLAFLAVTMPPWPGADEAFRVAGENWSEAITEFHIVGGLHPDLTVDFYLDLLRGLKERFPGVHLKGFTAVEIGYFSHITHLSLREVLERLKDAGLDSLPGGGAEIFAPAVRRVICDHKIGAYTWLKVHRLAHEMGMHSNATMLYGHIESAEDRVDHLLQLRKLQDETHGFQTFIPLAFHPANTELGKMVEHDETSGFMDLKNVAVARLLLDNFPHIKAYWIMMTPRVAQVALRFGADDLDGTVVEEKIYHDAGAKTPQALTRMQLIRLIREAGCEPFERDTLYRPVTRTETSVAVQV